MTTLQDDRYNALGFIKVKVIQIENLINDMAFIINAIEKAALIAIDTGAKRADLRNVGLSDEQINKIINNEVGEVEDDSETI